MKNFKANKEIQGLDPIIKLMLNRLGKEKLLEEVIYLLGNDIDCLNHDIYEDEQYVEWETDSYKDAKTEAKLRIKNYKKKLFKMETCLKELQNSLKSMNKF